jgi:peptidyl-prolyl cis-trans isomerase SurA
MTSRKTWIGTALALAASAVWAAAGPGLAAQDSSSVTTDSVSNNPDSTATAGPSAVNPADTLAAAPPKTAVSPATDTTFMVDHVVAVVGNRPVLASQVEEEIFSRESQGTKLPTDPEGIKAARQQIVSAIIDEELLVQQAQRDTSIKVTDEEIASGVEEQVRKVRGNFTSEVDYRAELQKAGFQTPEEYRRWLSEQQRRAAFQNRLIEKLRSDGKLKAVAPTENEMRQFFDEQKASLGKRPATLSFRQIVITPTPSAEAKAHTKARADSIVSELRRGADFATAARRFSQDPGSKEQGGSLNWFRRGVMVPEFERVAFGMRPGVISDAVESPFGFHIIQVERVQPAEVQARHILLVPDIDSVHVERARTTAEAVRKALAAGAPFDSLQRLYHDPSAEREAKDVPVTKLPENYAKVIGTADSGTVVPVFTIPAGAREQFVVLQVIGKRPEGDIRYEDVRDRIREQLGQQLAIRRYLDRLRRATYVEIRT